VAYCTQAQVQTAAGGANRLLQIANRTNATTIDATAIAFIADNIAYADSMIDSYAAKRYAVPFFPVPPIIGRMSAKIAALYMCRSTGMITAVETDELVSIEGKDGWLIRLARGEVSCGVEPSPPAHSIVVDKAGSEPTRQPNPPELTRDKLGGFW
jgi:phage gp36-like protein